MTFAPASIVDARAFLLATFDMHSGEVSADLDPDEVGIVGDPAHRGGYHCGRDRTVADDYSVVESPRDRAGLTLAASALDVGEFDQVVAGQRVTLRTLSLWLVEQCRAGAVDTLDIREVIYSPDGQTVKRWDRLGRRTSGDSSHLVHTHISYFRDSEARSKRPLFERFVAHLRGEKEEEVMGVQMLVRFSDAADPNQVWLCDGIHRRPVDAADLPGVGNGQTHQAGLLGPLGNGGTVFVSAGNPDVWGVDVRAAVKVDAGELAEALLADPAFAQALAAAAFEGSQRAERE